jgi:TP901 family phage tail tape measure protein
MALERFGLGAVITADDRQFVSANNRARDSLGKFIKTADSAPASFGRMTGAITRATAALSTGAAKIGKGVGQINRGLMQAAIGALPIAAAVGAGVSKAAQFEKQMSAVGSVTRATESDMSKLTKEAQRMGIVSSFSATQAGEGMEYLARAGANTDQIIAALQGTMNAAAADSIDLGTAADIVAQVVKGMNLEWGEAGHVADTLALASASANTNITQLGESFSYGVASAVQFGMSLEETTAIFGKLADAGLKGSLAGTSFVNMMNKLAKPTGKAQALMKKWNITLDNADGSLRKVSDIVDDFSKNIKKIPNTSERAAVATEVFGIRGARAYSALSVAGKASLDALEDKLLASSVGIGAATEMAATRLDNFMGKLTLFGSSIESLSIGIFGPLLKSFTPAIEEMTNGLNGVLFSLQGLNEVRQRENQEMGESAQLIAREAANRLASAGVTDKYTRSSLGALQVLSRMSIGEEKLSSAQVDARKRALQSTFETETKRRAELIRTQQLAAAGAQTVDDMSKSRREFMTKQIDAITKARQKETNDAINMAFSGAEGAVEAQKWLRNQVLSEALASNKDLTEADRSRIQQEIAMMSDEEAARSAIGDKIRSQIFSIEKLQEIEKEHGSAAVQIALGIQDAIDSLTETWNDMVSGVKEFGKTLETYVGKDGVRKIAKYATMFAITAAAIVPVILGLGALGFASKGVAIVFTGLKTVAIGALTLIKGAVIGLAGVFWPLLAAVAAVGIGFAIIRKDGESVGETLQRAWMGIKNVVSDVYENTLLPFINGFRKRWNELSDGIIGKWIDTFNQASQKISDVATKIKNKFYDIFGTWFSGLSNVEIRWEEVGSAIANGIAWVATKMAELVGAIVDGFVWASEQVMSFLEGPLRALYGFAEGVAMRWDGVKTSFLNLWEVIKTSFGDMYTDVAELANAIFGMFDVATDAVGTDFSDLFSFVGGLITDLVGIIAEALALVIPVVTGVFGSMLNIITTVVNGVKSVFSDAFGGIMQILEGDFVSGIKRIGIAILNAITLPIRSAISGLIELIQKIPGADELAFGLGIDLDSIQKWVADGITSNEMAAKISAKPAGNDEYKGKKLVQSDGGQKPPMIPVGEDKKAEISALDKVVTDIGDIKARDKARAAEKPKLEANINLEDKRTLDIKNQMCIDGEAVSVGTARHKQELQDRSGFKTTPWQRRVMLEHGTAPMNKAG